MIDLEGLSTRELHKLAKWDPKAAVVLLNKVEHKQREQQIHEERTAWALWERVIVWIIIMGAVAIALGLV